MEKGRSAVCSGCEDQGGKSLYDYAKVLVADMSKKLHKLIPEYERGCERRKL